MSHLGDERHSLRGRRYVCASGVCCGSESEAFSLELLTACSKCCVCVSDRLHSTSAEITDLLLTLPAASTACKTTARPEFASPVPDAPGQLPPVQMTDSEQRQSPSTHRVAALFMRTESRRYISLHYRAPQALLSAMRILCQ